MARLPSERYLIQQHDGVVDLFEDYTERMIVRFDPADGNIIPWALQVIRDSELTDEDKCFAAFWSGYFHAYAPADPEMPREMFIRFEDEHNVVVTLDASEIVRFDPADANASARAQQPIYASALGPEEKSRAHFWCGYFYGQGTKAAVDG
jgi:hypothetical protein